MDPTEAVWITDDFCARTRKGNETADTKKRRD